MAAFVPQQQKQAVATEMVLTSDLDSCPFLSWAETWGLFSGEREVESLAYSRPGKLRDENHQVKVYIWKVEAHRPVLS